MGRGRLLVIEGLDGSGKATQAAMLSRWLEDGGTPVKQVTFPDYSSDSSAPVRMYLAGEIGRADEVGAYAASSFYAVDRYISFHNNWRKAYEDGHTIVSDRYTTSNAYHQMSKLPREEWREYLLWMEDYEYGKLGLPKPDLVIYLDMAPEISRGLLEGRYGGNKQRDIHEGDMDYLRHSREAALYAAEHLHWLLLRCDDGEAPFSIDSISDKIRRMVTGH